jgi:glycerol-3-phosphate acyltransferase PlsY
MLGDVASIMCGYLLGSLPFAYGITRLATGKDIRMEGEGNVGARNVLHVAGTVAGLLTFLLDAGKGTAAWYLAQRWGSGHLVVYLTGFALMLGHGFPVWLHWHGGKGLAAAAGFLLPMWPLATLIAFGVLIAARVAVPSFDQAVAVAALAYLAVTLCEGNDGECVAFIVGLLGTAGLKRLIDLPYERATLLANGEAAGPQRDERARLRHAR